MSGCRVPELGVLVVGVTSWSGEGVEPKSLEVVFNLSKLEVLTLVTVVLLSLL
jgi:hypothetical protein